jgi:tRNA(Ile)-lysidine synthase
VAYSGGRDSTALLHATLQAARSLGVGVVALHVHHGLSPNADAWLAHCEARCARWRRAGHALAFASERIAAAPRKGDSIEAWARRMRYAALRRMALAHDATLVLLAHHRLDQAETFLLQALRGGGMAGLAGMPRLATREGLWWARPWLGCAPEAIEAYVRRHRLGCIVDESNADPRYDRSRLRRDVWPVLAAAFPHAEAALANAAARAHEAASALAALADIDLGQVAEAGPLDVAAWRALAPERRANALCAWLRQRSGTAPSASFASRLLDELLRCRSARWPLAGGEVQLHRGSLRYVTAGGAGRSADLAPREATLQVRRAGSYPLPGWAGVLRVVRTDRAGVPLAALDRLDLMPRVGAERWQAGPGRPARSLKKQFQAAGVPAWQRNGPLVYSRGRLLFVPGLGRDARMLAPQGTAQARLEWLPMSSAG